MAPRRAMSTGLAAAALSVGLAACGGSSASKRSQPTGYASRQLEQSSGIPSPVPTPSPFAPRAGRKHCYRGRDYMICSYSFLVHERVRHRHHHGGNQWVVVGVPNGSP